jgi:hypothetical protein
MCALSLQLYAEQDGHIPVVTLQQPYYHKNKKELRIQVAYNIEETLLYVIYYFDLTSWLENSSKCVP